MGDPGARTYVGATKKRGPIHATTNQPSTRCPSPWLASCATTSVALDTVTEARGALERASRRPDDAGELADMLTALAALRTFLDHDLPVHIAKEEHALFPALRDMAQLVDDMLGQHDEIRRRRSLLDEMLVVVDTHRDDILPERQALTAALQRIAHSTPADALKELHERVMRLDWILQGHFGDEEEHLLLPAATLLTAEDLDRLGDEMAAIETR